MRFDSVTFWLFFPLAWALWRFLPFAWAKGATLAASLAFYAWWRPEYVVLILASAVVDYHVGARIWAAREDRRRAGRWLLVSLATNLGLLAVFKYTPFLVGNVGRLTGAFRAEDLAFLDGWVVPVGISFYTFQTLSYSLDIHRGTLAPCKSFRDFFLYVSFFPQLVAGPIVRASELLPQLERRRRIRAPFVQAGLYRVAQGLFLKIVIADNVARVVNATYTAKAAPDLTPVEAWLSTIYFGVQIFADFAGYSGIAIGLAYLMGLRFPENFRYPYMSRSLSEFWTRWHITLSQWLRDYLYIPLGGNRRGPLRTYVNLSLTMLLGGLWHGAAWTYVAWGALHGLGLAVERRLRAERHVTFGDDRPSGIAELGRRALQILVVFVFVHTAWVFFRAPDFAVAWTMLERMYVAPFRGGFGGLGLEHLADARHLWLAAPVAALHLGQVAAEWYGLRKTAWRRATLAAFYLIALVVVGRGEGVEFIYFQF